MPASLRVAGALPSSVRMALLFLLLVPAGIVGAGSACAGEAEVAAHGAAPAGFRPLFDGRSLQGWHTAPRIGVAKTAALALQAMAEAKAPSTSPQGSARGRWAVQDGLIVGGQDELRVIHRETGEEWGLGSWLMTDATFGDFELLLDARPDWPCDTGIYVRSTALGQGFQVLLDHRGDDTAGIGGGIGFLYLRGIGGMLVNPYNYRWVVGADGQPSSVTLMPTVGEAVPLAFAAGPDDVRRAWRMREWNTFRIRVVGALPRITVWINEVEICSCDAAAIRHPDYDPAAVQRLLGAQGRIALEVHDGPAWRWGVGKVSRWRNLFIRDL